MSSYYSDDITAPLEDGAPGDKSVWSESEGHRWTPASGRQITWHDQCKPLLSNASKADYQDQEQTSGKTHWWHHNAAQQCPSTCALQSAGPTECQVTGRAQTSWIQPGLTAMQSSHLWITEALKHRTFTSDSDVYKAVVRWYMQEPNEFFTDGIWWLVHERNTCLNACGNFFLTVAKPSTVSIPKCVSVVNASYILHLPKYKMTPFHNLQFCGWYLYRYQLHYYVT